MNTFFFLLFLLAGFVLLSQVVNGKEDSDIANEIGLDKSGQKYPVVLINGWGGSALDGTTTSETKDYVPTKCNTEFVDKRIWISLNSLLNLVFKITIILFNYFFSF